MTRELRQLTVPEGVAGERIDSALTRVLGLSRTSIVKLLEDSDITTDNRAMQKSDRVAAGQLIDHPTWICYSTLSSTFSATFCC